jgi:hypothetical protein
MAAEVYKVQSLVRRLISNATQDISWRVPESGPVRPVDSGLTVSHLVPLSTVVILVFWKMAAVNFKVQHIAVQ